MQMASKAERLEARLTSTQRRQIEQAAALAGESVSSFVVLDRAEILLSNQVSTILPAAHFDELLASLDRAEEAPRLARVAREAARHRRIKAT
jgi:uncharacterized protein (DUF1778 family)